MKQREGPLELEKNLGKTMVVQNTSGRGPGVPGFYCETCNRTYKDSNAYLDHINGRARESPSSSPSRVGHSTDHRSRLTDLRALGQTTKISRSTVEQVRARIQMLREKTKEASNAKSYDFEQRLAEIKAKEGNLRAEKKKQKQAEKDRARAELAKDFAVPQEDDGMMKMMGFSGFGSSKK